MIILKINILYSTVLIVTYVDLFVSVTYYFFFPSEGSFSHGLSPQFVQQNQCLTPATTSTQLKLTYQRGLL